MVQCVIMECGMHQRGGHKTGYDKKRARMLLERIPTLPRADGHYLPFLIHQKSIEEWEAHFDSITVDSVSPCHTVADDGDADLCEIEKRYDENEDRDDLDEETMRNAQLHGIQVTHETRQELNDKLLASGVNPFEFLETDFPQAAIYPPAPLADPAWTPFLAKMALSNIYGQLNLMYKRADQVQLGMELLRIQCETHKVRLGSEKQTLLRKAQAVQQAQKVLDKMLCETRGLSGEIIRLNGEIASGVKNPKVKQFVEMQSRDHSVNPVFHSQRIPSSHSPAFNGNMYDPRVDAFIDVQRNLPLLELFSL
jgi:hypothetical protein